MLVKQPLKMRMPGAPSLFEHNLSRWEPIPGGFQFELNHFGNFHALLYQITGN